MIGIGIELGLLVGLPSINIIGGWRIVFGCALAPVHVMLVGLVRPWSLSFAETWQDVSCWRPGIDDIYFPFACMPFQACLPYALPS